MEYSIQYFDNYSKVILYLPSKYTNKQNRQDDQNDQNRQRLIFIYVYQIKVLKFF